VPTLWEHGTDYWGSENARLFQKDNVSSTTVRGNCDWCADLVRHIIGKPFLKFRELRGEAIKRMTEFGNIRAQWRETRHGELEQMDIPTSEQQRLQQAASIYRELASQFRAFAENEWLAVRVVQRLGYDRLHASKGLIGMSNPVSTAGGNKHAQVKMVQAALRISEV
jgi:hypothetical protein